LLKAEVLLYFFAKCLLVTEILIHSVIVIKNTLVRKPIVESAF